MFIAIDFLRVSDGINIEIYLSFLIKSFSFMNKKVRTKFKYPKK